MLEISRSFFVTRRPEGQRERGAAFGVPCDATIVPTSTAPRRLGE